MYKIITALFLLVFASITAVSPVFSQDQRDSKIQDSPNQSPDKKPAYQINVKGTSEQGGILFITVDNAKKDSSVECVWRGKAYTMIWQDNKYGVILPVALNTPKGSYSLKVSVKDPNNTDAVTNLSKIIPAKPHNYGTQHLWLSENQLSKYDNPQADRDNEDIHKALAEYTTGINWDKNFIWPVKAYVSTQFGLKRFYNNDKEPEYHRGLDLPAGYGTPVLASQRGIVRFAKKNLLLHGTTAVIDHGKGIGTLYIHMASLKVKAGDTVEQGDIIGTVGASGVSTGPHLHWAAYAHDEPIDPRLLFHLPKEWIDR